MQERIEAALRAVREPARAAAMQAYMKSAMPYLGVVSARVKAVSKEQLAAYPFASAEAWRDDVLALWRGAKFREVRYVALALTGHRRAKPFQRMDVALPMYEELIVTGAWWDYVDELAANRIGPLLAAAPVEMAATMRAWSVGDDMWKRRTSIICQLRFGAAIDRALLYACIEPSIESKEFFLRKAIGWALREYAKTDAKEVARYVAANAARLSGLSKREALKHIGG